MYKYLIALIVAAQVLVLVFMAAQREYIRATGTVVYFRTAPLDPRDPLRGDYVRLQYNINNLRRVLPLAQNGSTPTENLLKKDDVIYLTLDLDQNQVATYADHSTDIPEGKLFIKGRVDYAWQAIRLERINVRYGIEQFFVEQGKGLEMEKRMGSWGEMQIPLEVEVALGSDGTAITRGYRWSQLGIKTEVTVPDRNPNIIGARNNNTVSPRIKITIQNVSDNSLALVDNNLHCAFTLASEGWTDANYLPATRLCDNYSPNTLGMITLAPEQSHSFDFDLSETRWHLLMGSEVKEIGSLGFSDQFRLVYHSPSVEEVLTLPDNVRIWQGDLQSQAFYAGGRID